MKYRVVNKTRFCCFIILIFMIIAIIASLIGTIMTLGDIGVMRQETRRLQEGLKDSQLENNKKLQEIQNKLNSIDSRSKLLAVELEPVKMQESKLLSRGGQANRLAPRILAKFEANVSAYSADIECTGKTDGITFSGKKAKSGVTVAADLNFYPLGTLFRIEGFDGIYEVQDKGGAIKDNKIDIFMDSHEQALKFGRRSLSVEVLRLGYIQ
jgi:3D (Asp-Asp-Asp) domain-containing protein